MSTIWLFQMKTERMLADRFTVIAKHLRFRGKFVETEQALLVHDGKQKQALAYAQPCSKFAGLLFFTDQSRSLAEFPLKADGSGESVVTPLKVEHAQRLADEFLQGLDLLPRKSDDERVRLDLGTYSYQTDAIVFDGKERKPYPIKTEIASKITLNDIPVVGPRAKVRMVFLDQDKPVFVHRALWQSLEPFDERKLVDAGEIERAVTERLTDRRRAVPYKMSDIRLVYFAQEYSGGPDLLAPFYFVEVEFEPREGEKAETQGIKQVLRLPAYR
jgi:hypothetical protein